jgi:hypothetical protein
MFRQWLIIIAVLSVALAVQSLDVQAQEASTSPVSNAVGPQQIPFRMLQELAYGRDAQEQFRSKIPPKQIEAMKKAQADRSQRDNEIGGLSGKLGMSPFRNRRLRLALEHIKNENQSELHAEWLKIITPEQQAAFRSRNRHAILRASLDSQRPDQSLLNSQESIDQLLTNEDYLSIVEQPWIQDLLEITDEQFAKIEELQKLAQPEAIDTIEQLWELIRTQQAAARAEAKPQPAQSDSRKQLQERTMKVLSQEQTEKYKKFLSDPNRVHNLAINSSSTDPRERFLSTLPHGAAQSSRTDVKDGQSRMTIVLHNVFERPELIKELTLSDTQQKEIAAILGELSPQITAEMEAEQMAYREREAKQREAYDLLFKAHIAKFSAPALAILTESQTATLEKERFRGLGLAALQNPQLKAALKLNEEQSRSITEIQSRRGPQYEMSAMQPMTTPVSPEEFQKRSQEFQKRSEEYGVKAREFMDRQSEDIAAVLSDDQRITFTQMTGYKFPRDRGIRVPAPSP